MNHMFVLLLLLTIMLFFYHMQILRFFYNQIEYNILFYNKDRLVTIDDVPSEHTQQILDKLNKMGEKVILFVIGSLVTTKNKELLIQAVKDGHVLGNHGMVNRKHWRVGYDELLEEVKQCENIINGIYLDAGIQRTKHYYRPGSGFVNKTIYLVSKELQLTIMLGSVYPHDAQLPFSSLCGWYVWLFTGHDDIVILHDRKWTISTLDWLPVN